VEGEDEGEGETKCKGTKQMGQKESDEVNVGRNDRVPVPDTLTWTFECSTSLSYIENSFDRVIESCFTFDIN
jgi:hypothetical protein